tara:strand:+ start:3621 stop:4895 length:1275 start_codon:yes stop_codon:yes gene_type:complete
MDLLSAFLVTALSITFLYPSSPQFLSPFWVLVISSSLFLAFSQCLGLHENEVIRNPGTLLPKSFYAAALTGASLGAISVMVFFLKIPFLFLSGQVLALFAAQAAIKTFIWHHLKKAPPTILILGPNDFCRLASQKLQSHFLPLQIRSRPQDFDRSKQSNLSDSVAHKRADADELVIPDSDIAHYAPQLSQAIESGVPVTKYSRFIEKNFRYIPVRDIDIDWFLSSNPGYSNRSYLHIKRALDIAIGLVGITLSLPLITLAGIGIYLTDGGGIFYSQTRLGLRKKPFKIYKLRTMIQNAERSGPKWAAKQDSRITFVGKILRRSRIDELPQFWNILKGDMSFIGPRPERPEFTLQLEETIPHFSKRHLIKPGLTGWAQINYPYGASEEDAYEKLTLDLYYIKNASLWLDLKIAFRTIGAAMQGAR